MPDQKLGKSVLELSTDPTKLNTGIDQSKKKTKELDKSFQSAGKSLAKFGAIAAAASLAIAGIVRIAGDLIETFKVQEVAQNALTAAIKASGKEATISAKALIDYAGDLQKVTLFGDEATISSMALLQSLADISEKGLKQIAPLVQDMATVLKMDLRTIGSLIGKTIGSTTNALTRYGIEIDMTGTKSEKFALLVAELENRFGGAAVAMGTTATGALVQFNNALGDLKELGGQVIAEGIAPIVRWLTEVAIKAAASAKEMQAINQAIIEMQELGIEGVSDYASAIAALQLQLEDEAFTLEQLQKSVTLGLAGAEEDLRIAEEKRKAIEDQIALLKNQESFQKGQIGFQKRLVSGQKLIADNLVAIVLAEERIAEAALKRRSTKEKEIADIQAELDLLQGIILTGAPLLQNVENLREEWRRLTDVITELKKESLEIDEGHLDLLIQITNKQIELEDATRSAFEAWKEGVDDGSAAAKELTDEIESWLQPLSTFTDQAVMAFGTLAVEGAAGAEAFGDAMKDALAGVLEALGQMFSVQALGAWAAVFGGNFAQVGAAVGYTAAATAAFLGAGIVRALAHGGDFFTSGPELVLVGDNPGGVEHVQADPVSSGGRADETPIHVQVMLPEGPIIDVVARASRNRTLVLDTRSLTNR